MTFGEFNAAIRLAVWPDLEPENLVQNHRNYIIDALIDLQLKVPNLQTGHTDFIPSNESLFHCGASLVEAPRGFIESLSTMLVASDVCCDEVKYDRCSKEDMDCLLTGANECLPCCGVTQPYTYYQVLGYDGYYPYPELEYCTFYPTPDVDKPCRARSGNFTLYRDQLWVFPNLQANEVVKLTWSGIKRDFADSDVLDDEVYDREVSECVELYLRSRAASVDDCDYTRAILFFE